MIQLTKTSLRWGLTLGMLLVMLFFGYVSPVHAQGIITGDTIPAGQTVANDVILFGDQVSIEGNVDGNVIAIGNGVTISGKVDGNVIIISQQALITGEVTDSVYALTLLLELGDTAQIGRNLAYVGGSLTQYPNAQVGRDLTGLFFGATLSGKVGGEIRAVIGPVDIVRLFVKTFNIDIKLPDSLPWKTTGFHQPGVAKLAAPLPVRMLQDGGPAVQNSISSELLTRWGISRLKEFISLLLIGLVLVLFFPAFLESWSNSLRAAPMLSVSYGLVIAIVGNIGGLLALLLAIALGLGFMALGLSTLGFMLGALGTLGVGLAYSVFMLFLTFLSKITVAYLVGALILKRFERPSRWYKILPFLLGLLIFVLAASIPFLGWVISVLVAFMGIGAIWMAMFPAQSVRRREADVQ
jgi:hypothetical protein